MEKRLLHFLRASSNELDSANVSFWGTESREILKYRIYERKDEENQWAPACEPLDALLYSLESGQFFIARCGYVLEKEVSVCSFVELNASLPTQLF